MRPNEWSPYRHRMTSLVYPGKPPPTVPSVPTGLTATTSGTGQISLSWSANPVGDLVLTYKLYRATGSNQTFASASLINNANVLAFIDNGLIPGGPYTYFLVATNALGDSFPEGGVNGTAGAGSVLPLSTFTLTPSTSGTLPYMVGVVLPKGLALGSVSANSTTAQTAIKRTWNDGSAKHVIITGTQSGLVAGTPVVITVNTGTDTPGTPLNAASIQSAAPAATVNLGTAGLVNLFSLLGSPLRTWLAGPELVECHYQTTASSGLLVNFYVRLWKSGKMRVRVSVENGWFDQTLGTLSYSAIVTIGGTIVFNSSITQQANTRWSVIGWIASDPQVIATQNVTDVIKTKLVPNYFAAPADSGTLSGLVQTYLPMTQGPWPTDMGGTGASNQIGIFSLWDTLYLTNAADTRAYAAVLAGAESLNTYGIVWRYHADSDKPIHPSASYGNISLSSFNIVTGSLNWDAAHHGSGGVLAYMISGDYYYKETMELQAGTVWITCSNQGNLFNGSLTFSGQVRQVGWTARTVSQYDALAPTGDTSLAGFQKLLDDSAAYHYSVGTAPGVPPLGIPYTRVQVLLGNWNEQMWEHDYLAEGFGYAIPMESLTSSVNLTNLYTFCALAPVGRLGDNITGMCFNFAGSQAAQVGPISCSPPIDPVADTQVQATAAALQQLRANWQAVYLASVANSPVGAGGVYSSPCTNTLQGSSAAQPTDAAQGYWGYLLPNISLAVDLGITGAQTSWSRMTGATNWTSILNSGFPDYPIWGVQPRNVDLFQTFVNNMAPGTWKFISAANGAPADTTMAPAEYANDTTNKYSRPGLGADYNAGLATRISASNGPSSIMGAWGGGCLDTTRNNLIVWGGGHQNYYGNEVMAFSIPTMTWQRLTTPSEVSNYICGHTEYADGRPTSTHTYGIMAYDSVGDQMVTVGGITSYANGCTGNVNSANVYAFSCSGFTWSQLAPTSGSVSPGLNAVFDPSSRSIYTALNDDAAGLRKLNLATNTWSQVYGGGMGDYHMSAAIQPGIRMVSMSSFRPNGVDRFDFTAAGGVFQATTGDNSATLYAGPFGQSAQGIEWYPTAGAFVSWVPGTTTVYSLNPTTWVWTAHTATGDTPPGDTSQGMWKRFSYVAKYNVFIAAVSDTDNVIVYKPNF